MAAHYGPVIVCVIFAIGTVAQQAHTGPVVHGEHGGHGGQVIQQKISDTVDASIARATDPFGVSQGRRASTHGSHGTHGEHGAHGVQTGHEGHGIIGGSHGVQGRSSHGSDSKAGQGNHGHQKSDHTEHRQTSIRQGSIHGHGSTFKQIGHDIDSGRHSDHKTVVQEVMKSHDLPVPKVKDGHSISEINAVGSHAGHTIPTHTSIIKHDNTNNLKSDHEIHESVGRQNINAENITHGHTLSSQGTQDRHDSHVKDMHVSHSIPSVVNQHDNTMHSGQDMDKEARIGTHNVHSVHDSHALSLHKSRLLNNDAGHDGHTMPFHDTTPRHNVDHNAHRGNVKPSIENENHLPRINAHEIHSGHSMITQSGSANPSRHIKIEGSETMAAPEHKSRVSPSHDVHEVPTIKQNISTMQTEHGGHIIPTQKNSDKLAIWGNSKEVNHGVHTPDVNVQRIPGTPSHLPPSLTQLPDKRTIQSPSNVSNQWQHSNIRHISPKPQVHEAHGGNDNFNMKNSRLPSDGIGSGVNGKVAEHGDHRMNDHLPNVTLMFNSVDPSANDSTVNQHTGGHTMKNDTKRNHVDVLGTRQSNTQQRVDLVIPRTLEIHQAQQQQRKENIHTVTGLMEGLNSKKEASSNVELIGNIDHGEMELHDHPVITHASFSDPDGIITVDPNLNVDRSRIHAESNLPNVNNGTGQNTSIVHTTSQKGRVANSTASSLNLNNFLENINAELNNKGFGFVEPITSNSDVPNSIGQQRPGAIKRQDNHNIPAHTDSSFDAGTVSNWGQGQGVILTGFKNNRGMHDRNNRHQLPPTTPSPPIESTTVFVQQFSGGPTSMDSVFMRMFDPLTADMMLNRNVYPPVVDPFNDPRVPHNHGPMTSPVHNNGISIFDFFAGEF